MLKYKETCDHSCTMHIVPTGQEVPISRGQVRGLVLDGCSIGRICLVALLDKRMGVDSIVENFLPC